MILQTLVKRQRCHAGVRFALVLLALTMALAPAVDRAADASTLKANGDSAKSLDLCTVTGLVVVPLAPTPTEVTTPVEHAKSLHFPSPMARSSDHPPRPA